MPFKPIDDITRRNMLEVLDGANKLVEQIKQLCEVVQTVGAGLSQALAAQTDAEPGSQENKPDVSNTTKS